MKHKATNISAWIFLHFSKVEGLDAAEVAYPRCISKIPPLLACMFLFFLESERKKTPSSPYRKRSEMCSDYVLLRILRRITSREGGRNRPKIGAEQEVRSMISRGRGRWVRLGLGRQFSYFFLSSDRILGNLCDRPGGTEGEEEGGLG